MANAPFLCSHWQSLKSPPTHRLTVACLPWFLCLSMAAKQADLKLQRCDAFSRQRPLASACFSFLKSKVAAFALTVNAKSAAHKQTSRQGLLPCDRRSGSHPRGPSAEGAFAPLSRCSSTVAQQGAWLRFSELLGVCCPSPFPTESPSLPPLFTSCWSPPSNIDGGQ